MKLTLIASKLFAQEHLRENALERESSERVRVSKWENVRG